MLQSMGSQGLKYNLATEQQQNNKTYWGWSITLLSSFIYLNLLSNFISW